MTWDLIRAHYARLFEAAKLTGATQHGIAVAGGLSQNAISKLLANRKLGPRVETFVGAVEGLGFTVAQFFADLNGVKLAGLDQARAGRQDLGRQLTDLRETITELQRLVLDQGQQVAQLRERLDRGGPP